jgi:Co/Zn/Cd efflux system component
MIFHSPAAYVMWLIAFLLFFSLEKIAHEMTVISFVGFLSNLCGAVLFKFAASRKDK